MIRLMKKVTVGNVSFANNAPFSLLAGPCVLESRQHAFDMAGKIKETCGKLGIGVIYKTSFDKANRSSLTSERGVGLDDALAIFSDIKQQLGLSVMTDVHEPWQCAEVAKAVDVLQIPAFLCRQTDLLLAAGKTGKAINVKKGQFRQHRQRKHPAM
jgi:2-dehydro-3-deoxyphosphooctonate aldolase (KDO 8-P synthase)